MRGGSSIYSPISHSGRQITHLQTGWQATTSSPRPLASWASSGVCTGDLALALWAQDILRYLPGLLDIKKQALGCYYCCCLSKNSWLGSSLNAKSVQPMVGRHVCVFILAGYCSLYLASMRRATTVGRQLLSDSSELLISWYVITSAWFRYRRIFLQAFCSVNYYFCRGCMTTRLSSSMY